ncbi:hypothetical protein QBC32DRAFT_354134, partial [Pseudoneurospora amorphoporcata]
MLGGLYLNPYTSLACVSFLFIAFLASCWTSWQARNTFYFNITFGDMGPFCQFLFPTSSLLDFWFCFLSLWIQADILNCPRYHCVLLGVVIVYL